jgi:hypothetical protein
MITGMGGIPPQWLIFEGRLYGLRAESASVVQRALHVDRAATRPASGADRALAPEHMGRMELIREVERLREALTADQSESRRWEIRRRLTFAIEVLRDRQSPQTERVKARGLIYEIGDQAARACEQEVPDDA